MPTASPNQQQVLEAIVARTAKDRVFREELLADPRRAIQDAFGIKIPLDFRIKFIERGPDVDALIVLPDLEGGNTGDELSEADLEAVAGGQANASHQAHTSWSRAVAHHTSHTL